MTAPTHTLSNGQKIPVLGLGTWQGGDDPSVVEQAIQDAVDAGYRHFDCAFIYRNEKEIGKALRGKIAEGVLWNTMHERGEVVPACKKSLENFGFDYIDLYLIHWPITYKGTNKMDLWPLDEKGNPIYGNVDFLDTWRGMEECVKLGLTKSIGFSNFNSQQIDHILSIAEIKPVMNQVECHPNLNQKKLRDFCAQRGISITAYSPFGSPKRTWAKPTDPQVTIEAPEIIAISQKYGKTPAQVVLRYLLKLTMAEIPSFTFSNGYKMPTFGLGTYQSRPGEVEAAVMEAINLGYRHIDTAFFYQNEKEIGQAVQTKIKDGTVKREDLFITTKLWNNFHKETSVVPTCKKSLENLGLSYVDLYLVHWPFAFQEGGDLLPRNENGDLLMSDTDYLETWKGMEECARLGLTRSIGISNFNQDQITRLLSVAEIKPVNNQVEVNVNVNQKPLIEFCKKHNITITGYSPLGQPGNKAGIPTGLDNPVVIELSKKYNKTPAQIILRYVLQQGVAIIPKTVTPSRLKENMNIFDFFLTNEEMASIDKIGTGQRVARFGDARGHKYYPFD
ncbi:Alcohol dehydrogenase [NADP(+)] A [Melipona quadrifasciata]|uniref:Alcohol dehydrogenase [NADP(+)] A n=1 Tax=Melipona quadrifasciata TaxID=166423 RepID=A0A0M9AC26_9HYME|nr:Alcohol dehydrogenase [NADP(+)] A [Melipona quadrifasciata]